MSNLLPADDRFDLLQRALEITGLDAAVAAPGADLTVLAPTDGAFLRLAHGLVLQLHLPCGLMPAATFARNPRLDWTE